MKIESTYLHEQKDRILVTESPINPKYLIHKNSIFIPKIKILLTEINKMLHYDVISIKKIYEYPTFIFIVITKNDRYDTIKWYPSFSNENIKEWAIIIGISNNKFNNLGVYRYPKDIKDLPTNFSESNLISDTGNQQEIIGIYTPTKKNPGSCWYSNARRHLQEANNIDSTELYCFDNGGIWDRPCQCDSDCPKFRSESHKNTCTSSGTCTMPKGVERIGYTGHSKIKSD